MARRIQRLSQFFFLTLTLSLLTGVMPLSAQTTFTWTGAGDGQSFDDPQNWTPAGIPGASDTAVIDLLASTGYTVTISTARTLGTIELRSSLATLELNSALTVNSDLTMTAGTITGPADLTIDGVMTWRGGVMSGAATTTVNGAINITGGAGSSSNSKTLAARRLLVPSGVTAVHSGAYFSGRDGAVLDIQSGATWEMANANNFRSFWIASGSTSAPRIENAGTFRKASGGGGTIDIRWDLANSGTVENADPNVTLVLEGALQDADGTYIASAGVLSFAPTPTASPVPFQAGSVLRSLPGARLNLGSQNSSTGGAAFDIQGTLDMQGSFSVRGSTAPDVVIASTATVQSIGSETLFVGGNRGRLTVDVTDPLSVNNLDLGFEGDLSLSGPLTVGGTFALRNSTASLTTDFPVTVQGLATWQGGRLLGASSITMNQGLNLTGGAGSSSNGKLLDTKRLVLPTGQTAVHSGAYLNGANGATIEIQAGATWEMANANNFRSFWIGSGSTSAPRIENAGTFRKASGGGGTIPIRWDLVNSGTVENADATVTLVFESGIEDNDGLYVATAGVLNLAPRPSATALTFQSGSTLRSLAGARLNLGSQSGNADAARATMDVLGTVDIQGSLSIRGTVAPDVIFDATASIANLGAEGLYLGGNRGWLTLETTDPQSVGDLYLQFDGRLTLNSDLAVTGILRQDNSTSRLTTPASVMVAGETYFQGGTWTGGGEVILNGGLQLVGGAGSSTNSKRLDNLDMSIVSNPVSIRTQLFQVGNGSRVVIEPGVIATIDSPPSSTRIQALSGQTSAGLLLNQGTILTTTSGIFFDTYIPFRNEGTLDLGPGLLTPRAYEGIVNAGTIRGAGQITGNIVNQGTISPGVTAGEAGILTISGALQQAETGVIRVDLNGTVAGTDYDRLNVGNVELTGTLELLRGPSLTIGESVLTPIEWGSSSQTGAFTEVVGQDVADPFLGIRYGTSGFQVFDGSLVDLPTPTVFVVMQKPPFARSGRSVPVDVEIFGSTGVLAGKASGFDVELSSGPLPDCGQVDAYDNLNCRLGVYGESVPPPGTDESYPFLASEPFPALPPTSGGDDTAFTGSSTGAGLKIRGTAECPDGDATLASTTEVTGFTTKENLNQCAYELGKLILSVVPGYDCYKLATSVVQPFGDDIFGAQFDLASYAAANTVGAIQCAGDALPSTKAIKIMIELNKAASGAGGIQSTIDACFVASGESIGGGSDSRETECIASYDPNDKFGPPGVLAERYTSDTDSLPYAIFFENLPAATAAAQTVVISDTVDVSVIDMSTFSFGMVTWADTAAVLAPNQLQAETEVDLRPDKDVIVRIEALADETTGVLTWTFTSLDPATGAPTTDPLAGFLSPNQTAPEGEGIVSYFADVVDGTPSGTQFGNAARIVFDENAPIDTRVHSNVLDLLPPSSAVSALDAEQNNIAFTVNWSGTDAESGINDYTIYVSEDGGSATVWQDSTSTTSGEFVGQRGSTYSFYSVARDRVGFVENAPGTPDAVTTVADDALPVDMTSFEGRADGDAVQLTWRTASEENSAGFYVERAIVEDREEKTTRRWESVGYVSAAGTTSEPQTYRYPDQDVPFEAGVLAYRLRQIDVDGAEDVSREILVDRGAPERLALHATYPNPTSGRVTMRYELPTAMNVQIELFDVLGRRLAVIVDREESAGRREAQLDLADVPSGNYFLRIRGNGSSETRRITVVR